MFIPRDDINNPDIALNQHREYLERSRQYPDPVTPLKTKVTRVYKLSLAHVGRKLVAWGYQMHKKSGITSDIPLLTPPYALGEGR